MIGGGWGGGATPNAPALQEMTFDTASVERRAADRRCAHQLHPARRRQPVQGTVFGELRQRAACRATNFDAALLARDRGCRTPDGEELGLQSGLRRTDQEGQALVLPQRPLPGCVQLRAPACSSTRTRTTRRRGPTSRPEPAGVEREDWIDAQMRADLAGDAEATSWRRPTTQQDFCDCHDAISATTRAGSRLRTDASRCSAVLLDWTVAADEPAADRSERHSPRRALGQHAPAGPKGLDSTR